MSESSGFSLEAVYGDGIVGGGLDDYDESLLAEASGVDGGVGEGGGVSGDALTSGGDDVSGGTDSGGEFSGVPTPSFIESDSSVEWKVDGVDFRVWAEEGFGRVGDDEFSRKRLVSDAGVLFSVDDVIAMGVEMGAADIMLNAHMPVSYKVLGEVRYIEDYGLLKPEMLDEVFEIVVPPDLKKTFPNSLSVDTEYTVRDGVHAGRRCRLNVGRSMGVHFFDFRILSDRIPLPSELGVEDEVLSWMHNASGVILVNGATGTGKTTTLSSMLNYVNMNMRKKIITIEKPVENLLPRVAMGHVTQRSVGAGLDTPSFSDGLRDALREAPDIILVGEVRDREEMTTLIEASDSGHLSLSTMHTNSASKTLSRIEKIFEGSASRILDGLANNTIGFVNQVLVLKPGGGGRVAVREVLPFDMDDEIRLLVSKGDVRGLYDFQFEHGITMEHRLVEFMERGLVDKDDAVLRADNRRALRSLLGVERSVIA